MVNIRCYIQYLGTVYLKMIPHSKGIRARVLFSSVFGPYAQDDEFGSRKINPMELYHNQVTREQGPFSLRMFHRSWGILMIQKNISAPTTVLDFPTREAFAEELRANQYDIVGISSIIVNVGKVREMCRMVRELSPQSTIVIGGHVAAIPEIEKIVDAALGLTLPITKGTTAATIIPSVGCPMGCNFCTTSAFFGGKGRYLNFYDSGKELYEVMCEMEGKLEVKSFFMMDENFLLHKRRAMELLELMKAGHKAWSLYVFSSANAISQYSMRELVELGVSWIWMGLESPRSAYTKLKGADTITLTAELRKHGIKLLGSTIVGLEHHTPENIEGEIEHAVAHDTDFHQFMLYTPVPGTPLFFEMKEQGRMLPGVNLADIHGQHAFNFAHAAISAKDSKYWLDFAFRRDFERNGPSIYRICRTTLDGYRRYKNDADSRVRERFAREARALSSGYSGALWAMEHHLRRTNPAVAEQVRAVRQEIGSEFGLLSRVITGLLGPYLLWTARREERRLAEGMTYEPPTIIERRNWTLAEALDSAVPALPELVTQGD